MIDLNNPNHLRALRVGPTPTRYVVARLTVWGRLVDWSGRFRVLEYAQDRARELNRAAEDVAWHYYRVVDLARLAGPNARHWWGVLREGWSLADIEERMRRHPLPKGGGS